MLCSENVKIQRFVFFLPHQSLDLILRFVYIANAVPICIMSLMFLKRPVVIIIMIIMFKCIMHKCNSLENYKLCAICDCTIVVFNFL